MAASLPNEAEFGFWPPRFLKQQPVVLFCFFTSPEGQLPRRGILVIGAGPNITSIKKSNQINIGPHEMRGNKACATRVEW